MLGQLRRWVDNFTLTLVGVVILASVLPAQGRGVPFFEGLTVAAIALLFFMHGAKLSRQAIISGATHWRLHLVVFGFTFVAFPLLGVLGRPLMEPWLGTPLTLGMLYLCVLPGTVQSAIAFNSLARGNVPAAICNASASSLIGILATPLLVMLIMGVQATGEGYNAGEAVLKISLQLLLPFVLGHMARPWIGDWVARNRPWLSKVDQSSILLVVYTAFSASVVGGLWQTVGLGPLAALILACCVLLALVLVLTTALARGLGFNKEDEITIVFGASKKSLATGVPMAQVLFAGSALGPMLLPIMLFHQIQLIVCAILAQRYAQRPATAEAAN